MAKLVTMAGVLLAAGFICFPVHAAELLNSKQIRDALVGTSIIDKSFGCVYYENETTAILYLQDGTGEPYDWRVERDKYVSSGSCQAQGCQIRRDGHFIEFHRIDGNYSVRAFQTQGNSCEAGQLSS